jgi:hypothetical protein
LKLGYCARVFPENAACLFACSVAATYCEMLGCSLLSRQLVKAVGMFLKYVTARKMKRAHLQGRELLKTIHTRCRLWGTRKTLQETAKQSPRARSEFSLHCRCPCLVLHVPSRKRSCSSRWCPLSCYRSTWKANGGSHNSSNRPFLRLKSSLQLRNIVIALTRHPAELCS